MNEEPTRDLATRAFYKRVLDEFAAVRKEIAEVSSEQAEMRPDQVEMRQDIAAMRADIAEIRSQQAAMARNIATLDQRLTTLEERVDSRLKETRPIWEAVQEQLRKIAAKFDLVLNDLYEVRSDVRRHDRLLIELENKTT